MDLPLSVLVRIAPDHSRVRLLTTGCLTETNQRTLYPLIRRMRSLTADTEVVIDLTGIDHLEGAALDLLCWEVEHDQLEAHTQPVRVVLTQPPPAGRWPVSPAYRTGSTAWTRPGTEPVLATRFFRSTGGGRHLPGPRARPVRGQTMAAPAARRSPVRTDAVAYGAVFVLVGVLGFVPGITTGYDSLRFAGHSSEALLLGVFQVSILHNLLHLLYGIVGLALARTLSGARAYLRWGGAIYLLLWLYGLVIDKESTANVVPVNSADDWLHLLLGATMVGLSCLGREPAARSTTGPDY
ncbi:hypothetical protein GCM10011374_41490 [Kocuria dechangensis]|uniref:DUF4383 domain-containing protein n=1 Tax=Kocuria dechangensis TaxID=1176249 RepID=A0A917HB95_9MICC|nr:DUF4383 domain-containing protein [Kocuria dechangensis]GGG72450.1 hypothetical protein GCM10011374_41490 [Kocuria dechangensis]